jgi:hypothetical protein
MMLFKSAGAVPSEVFQHRDAGDAQTMLNLYDQCGGMGFNCAAYACVDAQFPGVSCPPGTTCQRLHE